LAGKKKKGEDKGKVISVVNWRRKGPHSLFENWGGGKGDVENYSLPTPNEVRVSGTYFLFEIREEKRLRFRKRGGEGRIPHFTQKKKSGNEF